jgi:hypothetical protein
MALKKSQCAEMGGDEAKARYGQANCEEISRCASLHWQGLDVVLRYGHAVIKVATRNRSQTNPKEADLAVAYLGCLAPCFSQRRHGAPAVCTADGTAHAVSSALP